MAAPQQQTVGPKRPTETGGRPGGKVQGHLPLLVRETETRVGRVGPGVAEVEGEKYKDVEAAQGGVAHPTGQPRPPTEDGVPRMGTLGEKMDRRRLAADAQPTRHHQQKGVVQVHRRPRLRCTERHMGWTPRPNENKTKLGKQQKERTRSTAEAEGDPTGWMVATRPHHQQLSACAISRATGRGPGRGGEAGGQGQVEGKPNRLDDGDCPASTENTSNNRRSSNPTPYVTTNDDIVDKRKGLRDIGPIPCESNTATNLGQRRLLGPGLGGDDGDDRGSPSARQQLERRVHWLDKGKWINEKDLRYAVNKNLIIIITYIFYVEIAILYTHCLVVSKIVSDSLTPSKIRSKTLSKSLLNPHAKEFKPKDKTKQKEKEFNKLMSSNIELHNSRLNPKADSFTPHIADPYPTAYLTELKTQSRSTDLSRDDSTSNSSYDLNWDIPEARSGYTYLKGAGGRIGIPKERYQVDTIPNLPEEVPKRRGKDRIPYDLIHDAGEGQANRILWRYEREILETWDVYKRRPVKDQRPHSWILQIFYFNEPELVVSYYDWLRSQNIDIPSRQVIYHQHSSIKHLRPRKGDNICLCYCCGPDNCTWTDTDHANPCHFDEWTRDDIARRERELRDNWSAYRRVANRTRRRIRREHPADYDQLEQLVSD